MPLPANVRPSDKIVLIDGHCRLCNAGMRFLLRQDRARQLKVFSVQSAEGQAILDWFGLPSRHTDALLYVDDRLGVEGADAVLRLLGELPAPWSWLRTLWLVPRPLRDWCYESLMSNRYQWFGREARRPAIYP
ncbi:DCC1-like thiol-disulfide oxidoreductase family protein [Pseudomonas sp. CAN2814]|uniref:thiol-disulfide oxidoreductase DCC family protein n=1 Tax=Pseudomonas sp. CAN1 TaxID=3046726 RepID=UPI002649C8B6|nr:DCC1-like thiol-disulfide oxidoreductase family protein [Pseudomonas sp. CAN1]MDN6859558.1 DCC1-like thiol-disulfide oxidoreductase family protein [Pseudomonas sp. CAN1]